MKKTYLLPRRLRRGSPCIFAVTKRPCPAWPHRWIYELVAYHSLSAKALERVRKTNKPCLGVGQEYNESHAVAISRDLYAAMVKESKRLIPRKKKVVA
jgi:hypothetical protein